MMAFDTDILTEILAGNPAYAKRIEQIPLDEQSAPIGISHHAAPAGQGPGHLEDNFLPGARRVGTDDLLIGPENE